MRLLAQRQSPAYPLTGATLNSTGRTRALVSSRFSRYSFHVVRAARQTLAGTGWGLRMDANPNSGCKLPHMLTRFCRPGTGHQLEDFQLMTSLSQGRIVELHPCTGIE